MREVYYCVQVVRGASMKSRQILITILIVATLWHTAAAQPKKNKTLVDGPAIQSILAGTDTASKPILSDLIVLKPEMPLGPQDILKSYEITMSLVADKTLGDFVLILQAQQANQITREQAEYLLQQRYQIAMMQYEVLSALHDVLEHDIDEAALQSKSSLKTTSSDTVLITFPGSAPASR
jgi:hypothetical protein